MKQLFLTLFLFVNLAFGFDSVKVSDKSITLHKYGYFTTKQELSPLEALQYSEANRLLQLSKNAKSFGFDSSTYWFVFDISTYNDNHGILDIKNLVASSCELFVFQNKKLIRHDKKAVNSILLQFNLEIEKQNTIYLVKIHSKNPHYSAFEFGKKEEIDKTWNILFVTTIAAFAISAVMIFYNLALFFAIRDTTYLYYCLYIGSYLAFNLSVLGFLPHISPFFASVEPRVFVGVFLQTMYIGLTLFTIKFLQLEKNDPKLKRQLLYILYFMLFSTLLIPINQGLELIAVFSMALLAFFLLYSVVKTYIKGYKPALFYLIATGVAIIFNMLFMNMNQGGGIPYTIWTFSFVCFGLMWDIFFLSFAIAHRISLLHEENLKNERLAMMKSRQKVIGELTGNIAHQWRQPLNILGSIVANIEAKAKYDHLQTSELLESCELSSSVLRHLSDTIDTLQDFFVDQEDKKENFDISEHLASLIHFLEDSMSHQNITINFTPQKTIFAYCDKNLFSQVVMNILLNAKDALIANNQSKEKVITITTSTQDDMAIITVSDNGGGVKIEPIERIFEPFVSGKTGGSGIGLYLSKSIVEKIGGMLTAENTGGGARFILVLPCIK